MSTPTSIAEYPTLCPAPEKLGKLLRDELEPTEIGSVEEHIGLCPGCQRLLGRLVGSLPDALAAHGRDTDETPPDLPGYAVLQRIDAGGMGVVWRVRDLQFGRDLAVKVMASWSCNLPRLTERFLAEAQICARLTHPSIVPVHTMSRLPDGRPYYTMKLVEGQTLAALLHGRPAPAERRMEFVQIFAQVCQALAFAHGRGIIHRDLKPENVMVGAHGEVQLMDWGLAKMLGDADPDAHLDGRSASTVIESGRAEAARTHAGSVLGTIAYMAPEQAQGLNDQVDCQSDVFGLGGILCKILTGEPPYCGPNAGIVRLRAVQADLGQTLERLHSCGADPELIQLVQRCLAPRKADRPRDAGVVASQLAAYQARVQQRLRQAELERAAAQATAAAERTARWRTRALAAAVLALVMLAAGGAMLAAWRLEHERDRAVANQRAAEQAEEQAKEQLWTALLSQARANRWSRRMGRNFDSLDVLSRAVALRPSLELRNEAIACMALPDLRPVRQWDFGIPHCYGLAFDADLERYAFSDEQGMITIRRFADNCELLRLPGGGVPAWVLQFSPDGRFLAARCHRANGDSNTIFVWDIGKAIRTGELPDAPRRLTGQKWDFHPDSRHLAASCVDGSLCLYDLSGKESSRELNRDKPVWRLAFDPEGRRLAAAQDSLLFDSGENIYPILIYDVRMGERLLRLRSPARLIDLSWREDGRRLAGAARDGNVYVWEPPSERPVQTLIGHQSGVPQLAFHPCGELLASIGWDGVVRLWDARLGRELLSSPAHYAALRFNRDGRRLALALDGARVGLYDMDRGDVCRTLRGHNETGGSLWSAAFHPDAPVLASASDEGVRLWDAQSGRELAAQPLRGCQSALFLPNGDLLTSSSAGLERWRPAPFSSADKGRALLERLPWTGPVRRGTRRMALAGDVRTFAVLVGDGRAMLLGGDQWTKTMPDLTGGQMGFIALSPNGRWAAAGTWQGGGTRIWDLHRGRQVGKELPGGDAFVAFSPDGRWLVNGSREEYRFWEVGSWRPGLRIARTSPAGAGPLAFSTDSKILAIAHSFHEVRLIETATGRELATLPAPEAHLIHWLCFRPDGEQLAVACANCVLQLWDLRRIRERLAEMGLDWEQGGASGPLNEKSRN